MGSTKKKIGAIDINEMVCLLRDLSLPPILKEKKKHPFLPLSTGHWMVECLQFGAKYKEFGYFTCIVMINFQMCCSINYVFSRFYISSMPFFYKYKGSLEISFIQYLVKYCSNGTNQPLFIA